MRIQIGFSIAVMTIASSFGIASSAIAQSADASRSSTCWAPKPLDDCRAWLVTEFGFDFGLVSTMGNPYNGKDFGGRYVLTLGRMRNTAPRAASGYTSSIGLAHNGVLLRGELRRRSWMDDRAGTDLSIGLATQNVTRTRNFGAPARAIGITAAASLQTSWVGLDLRGDLLRGQGRTATGLSAGIHGSSTAGAVSFLVFAAGFITLAVLVAGGVD